MIEHHAVFTAPLADIDRNLRSSLVLNVHLFAEFLAQRA